MRPATFGVLAVLVAGACRAGPITPSARYPAGTSFRARYLTVDHLTLRYVDAGSGTPVILLHGLASSLYSWRYVLAPIAAAGFRVIAFDNKGFGFSDKPPAGYSNTDYVRVLIQLMDSLKISDAVLVGSSMGGAIAADAALAYPHRVRGLVLIDAAGLAVRGPWLLRLLHSSLTPALIALRGRWITSVILKSTYADPHKVTGTDIDQYYAPLASREFGTALREVLREFRFDDLRGRLGGIEIPSLVIWGDEDPWIPRAVGVEFARALTRVAFAPVAQAGHLPQEEQPATVTHLLLEFLQHGVPPPPPDLALAVLRQHSFLNHLVEDSAGATETKQ